MNLEKLETYYIIARLKGTLKADFILDKQHHSLSLKAAFENFHIKNNRLLREIKPPIKKTSVNFYRPTLTFNKNLKNVELPVSSELLN